MKKFAAIIMFVICISLTVQGCAEVSQGFHRKFNEFTSWLDELDQKIQRHIRKTGVASISNKETITINSLQAQPEIIKKGETVEINFTYEIYKSDGLNTKIKYSANLYSYNKLLFQIFEEETEQDNGRWEDIFSFTVPASAKTGKYEVRYKITYEKGELQATTFFTVIR